MGRKEWNDRVMKIYNEEIKTNPKYKLKDAMKKAKIGYKK